ncbi:SPFH domain-containing protein, partial [Rhodopila globiformis]
MNDATPAHVVPQDAAALPGRAAAAAGLRLARRLALTAGLVAIVLGAAQALTWTRLSAGLLRELARANVAAVPLAAVLASLAGIAGAWLMARARQRGDATRVARAARWPQMMAVVPLSALVAAAALLPRFAAAPDVAPPVPETTWICGGALIVLAFPLLVAERVLAAWPPVRLPEAPGLRGLLFLPTVILPATGALEIAAGLGAPGLAAHLTALLALLPGGIAAELALRAVGRCFLPPPPAAEARAVESALARMLAEGSRARSLAEPLRQHLGIDFARSWALAYVRAAFAPLLLVLVLVSWGLSGVALVPLDQRAVYERFGAPVRVLHPGLHLILPWPLGRLRPVEFGTVHEAGLAGDPIPDRTPAE